MEEIKISMTNSQLKKASKRILEALNATQFKDGYTLEEVLMSALYVVGAGLKKRGIVLQLDAPLITALPPLVSGYKAQEKLMSANVELSGALKLQQGLSEQLFYLQDKRSYVGNDVIWWAKDGNGYTTDLSKANVYTKGDAIAQHNMRETDIPWPKEYIDAKTRPAVDMQYIKLAEALAGTGIMLANRSIPKRSSATGGDGDCQRTLDDTTLPNDR